MRMSAPVTLAVTSLASSSTRSATWPRLTVGPLAITLIGRPGDEGTAAITSAVTTAAVEVSSHHAWQQPILRLADTVADTVVGVATARAVLRVTGPRAKQGQ